MSQEGVAIARGLAYVRAQQQADGSFVSYSGPTAAPFTTIKTYRTVFTPAVMLSALADIAAAQDIRERLSSWLLTQKSPAWSFNYWAADAPERTRLRYPDDLDDTFCALSGLYRHDASAVDAAALGTIVKLLLATEAQVGGPYRTWLAAADAPAVWHDVDLAVNCNIAYFLRLCAEPLPRLTQLMEQAIVSKQYTSSYYPSAFPVLYYLARAYRGPLQNTLAEYILRLRKGAGWGTALQTALMMSALCELGHHTEARKSLPSLLASQTKDGSWPAEPFCLDPARKGRQQYSGSTALSTALALEAIQRCGPRGKPAAADASGGTLDPAGERLATRVQARARREFQGLDPTLGTSAAAMLHKLQDGGINRDIVLLPHYFAQSLREPTRLPAGTLETLGLANLYGWMAYTIFDDLLDGEGDTRLLPAASLCLRRSVASFAAVAPAHAAFQKQVAEAFDRIDSANAWEAEHCRFAVQSGRIAVGRLPQYGNRRRLAERSLGHTLTPLGVLAADGRPMPPQLQPALMQYLIARQLHDDLHDWEADLARGQISYVVAALLRELRLKPGEHGLAALMPRLQHIFWQRTLPRLCDVASQHLQRAHQLLEATKLCREDGPFFAVFATLETSLARTKAEQAKAQAFLAAYAEKSKT